MKILVYKDAAEEIENLPSDVVNSFKRVMDTLQNAKDLKDLLNSPRPILKLAGDPQQKPPIFEMRMGPLYRILFTYTRERADGDSIVVLAVIHRSRMRGTYFTKAAKRLASFLSRSS